MANFNLYIDVAGNSLVVSDTDSTPASLPILVQGDTPTVNIYMLQRNAQNFQAGQAPFTIINNAGLSLQVVIGEKRGDTNTFYATQFAWTADPQNKFFTAALALNTAQITTLIGTAAQSANVTFEVKYFQSGVPTTVLEIPCVIQAAVNKGGAVTPLPPGQTALSAEYANATFLTRLIQGQVVLVSPDGTKQTAIYTDNDGTFHADPLA